MLKLGMLLCFVLFYFISQYTDFLSFLSMKAEPFILAFSRRMYLKSQVSQYGRLFQSSKPSPAREEALRPKSFIATLVCPIRGYGLQVTAERDIR